MTKGVSNPLSQQAKHVRGMGKFVDDIYLPDMAYVVFVRSKYPHAKIKSINLDKLERVGSDKLLATLTGSDIRDVCRPIPSYLYTSGQAKIPRWTCLAIDEVNFVGEPIAAIVSSDKYLAYDLAEYVDVEYEPLEAVIDAYGAIQKTSPLVHDYLGSNVAAEIRMSGGNVDEEFNRSDFVVSLRVKVHRHTMTPIETRGAVASYDPRSDKITLWASTQLPFILRSHLAQMLGIPESKLRVIAPDVGGGFGGKLQISPEYVITCLLAMLTKRPVKWVESRHESLLSFTHAREQVHDVEGAFTNDGMLLAIRDRGIMDVGAYLDTRVGGQALCTIYAMQGPYKLRAIDAEIKLVLTNKCPYGSYRGFGFDSGTLIVERLMDKAARKLGIDPVEIRRRNLIKLSEMPYTTPLGFTYEPADYEGAMNLALRIARYDEAKRGRDLSGRLVGIGISIAVEPSSVNAYTGVAEPGMSISSLDFGVATVRMDASGKVKVLLGTASIGTGHAVAASKVVAEQLGICVDDVEVIEGDTELCPYDCGVRASRFSTVVLPAVLEASRTLRDKIVKIVAKLLEVSEGDVEISGGRAYVKGSPEMGLDLRYIARTAYANVDKLPAGVEPPLEATCTYRPAKKGIFNAYAHAVHIPVVELDPETGIARVTRYVVVEDCGNVVSLEVVDGQIAGGLTQVMGGVFLEELRYSEDGHLLTATFMDYLIPSASEALEPSQLEIEHTVTPSSIPGGYKGMAESSNMCGYAALINAINDALTPLGGEINETNVYPEKVWRVTVKAR